MHKYRVIEFFSGQNWLLLEGGRGRFHWARVLNKPPGIGAVLTGCRPHLGFGLLHCARSASTFRVVFETINGNDPSFNLDWMADTLSGDWPGRGWPGHEAHPQNTVPGRSPSEG